jgi:hypothetical protein
MEGNAESPLAAEASNWKRTGENHSVKAIVAIALILALGITGMYLWGEVHVQRIAVSSSQIFIHGTPVCVMQHAGGIYASVGMCGDTRGRPPEGGFGSGGGYHGGTPSPIDPHLVLPPGHPPVDIPPVMEEERRTLI